MPDLVARDRGQIFGSMNRVISAIHSLDPDAIELGNFGPRQGYLARQVTRWTKQYRASETTPNGAMEQLIRWLPSHLPNEGELRVVHGDYRLDNVLIHPTEPRIVAVLDWELATLGDPLADFAYHAMTWRNPTRNRQACDRRHGCECRCGRPRKQSPAACGVGVAIGQPSLSCRVSEEIARWQQKTRNRAGS